MPIVGNLAVSDLQNISGNEIDRLTFSGCVAERPREVTGEAQVRDDAIANHELLKDGKTKIRYRGEKGFRCSDRPGGSLRSSRRQGMVEEVPRDRLIQQLRAAIDPEAVKGIHRPEERRTTCARDIACNDQFLWARNCERLRIGDLSAKGCRAAEYC